MKTKPHPPRLTLRETMLGALAITLVSGLLGLGLLLYLATCGLAGVFSLGLGGVAVVAVLIGLVFLLVQYYGNREFWR
jgi:hypothetical protein